jgi:hypothetical protein
MLKRQKTYMTSKMPQTYPINRLICVGNGYHRPVVEMYCMSKQRLKTPRPSFALDPPKIFVNGREF